MYIHTYIHTYNMIHIYIIYTTTTTYAKGSGASLTWMSLSPAESNKTNYYTVLTYCCIQLYDRIQLLLLTVYD